jgi:hypothetical protein
LQSTTSWPKHPIQESAYLVACKVLRRFPQMSLIVTTVTDRFEPFT